MAEIKIIAVIGKLRPKVKRGRTVSLDDLADEIAGQSGFDRGDARDFAYKFARGLVNHLKYGDYVKLGEIGNFYLSCDKDKRVRVAHRASNELNRELAQEFRGQFVNGENAGLDDEGYAGRWLELHPEDTVIMRDGSSRTASA
jgi:nucleoid DNA-binding protein